MRKFDGRTLRRADHTQPARMQRQMRLQPAWEASRAPSRKGRVNARADAFRVGTCSRTRDAPYLLFDRVGGLPVVRFAAIRWRCIACGDACNCTCGLRCRNRRLNGVLPRLDRLAHAVRHRRRARRRLRRGVRVRRASPLRADFWRARLRALAACASVPLGVVYVAMLVVATRAVIPEGTGYSDAIYYHLAYAQDWANAGRLVVDPFMAFIFYANNSCSFSRHGLPCTPAPSCSS